MIIPEIAHADKNNTYLYCYPAGVDSVFSKWPKTYKKNRILITQIFLVVIYKLKYMHFLGQGS